MTMFNKVRVFALTLTLGLTARARADTYMTVSNASQLREVFGRATPGTHIVMLPGRYEGNNYITGVHGKPGAMIYLEAKDPARPPLFSGGELSLQLIKCSYIVLDGLASKGANVNGFQAGDGSHHVVLRNLRVDMTGARGNGGNCDGLKLPALTDFLIERCAVTGWGNGGSAVDMVGCARGLIMNCAFTRGPQGGTANGVEAKGGSFDIGVLRCRFEDAATRAIQFGGSTGEQFFRQGNRDKGYEAYDCVAMGNVVVRGEAAVAFVSCTGCVASYNTIVKPEKYVVRLLKEGGTKPCAHNEFSRNLSVLADTREVVNISPGVDVPSFLFKQNYWYGPGVKSGSLPVLPLEQVESAGGQDPGLDSSYVAAQDGPAAAHGARAPGTATAWAAHVPKFEWAWNEGRATASRSRPTEPAKPGRSR